MAGRVGRGNSIRIWAWVMEYQFAFGSGISAQREFG